MRHALSLAILSLFLVLPFAELSASGLSGRKFEFDFTKGGDLADKVAWSPADRLGLTDEGLGWDGRPASSFSGWVETTEPLAVGESCRAPESVGLGVKVHRDFEWLAREDLTIRVFGRVYARYSPDATHWSSWQQLSRDEDRDSETTRAYRGTLSVPRRQRESYEALVREYREGDVPWKGDEEAAVRWIAETDPEFLKRTMPFIGYVQVLYDTQFYGGHRLERIVVNAGWAIPGMYYRPRRAGADKGRRNIPWRYRGPDDPKVEEPDWTHVLEDGRLHVAADAADTKLDLRRTNISSEGLASIGNLENLESLNLFGTAVGDAGIEPVGKLVKLTELDLSRTRVTDAGLLHLVGLTALKKLGLRQTKVSDRGLAILRGMPHLEDLDLLGTKLTDATLETIGGLEALRTLSLWSTGVTNRGLAHLGELTELRELHLGGGRSSGITDAGVAHLSALPNLTELGLRGTAITDAALVHLLALENLEDLAISDTAVTQEALKAFMAKMPKLKNVR